MFEGVLQEILKIIYGMAEHLPEAKISIAIGIGLVILTIFKGRVGIFELLTMNEELRELVVQRASAGRLCEVARRNGMKLLREDGWDKVRQGLTTPEEVLRVAKA